MAADLEAFIAQVNAFFDPDQATGTILDARCAINGVVREPGTYTQQAIQITTSAAVVLQGLDLYPGSPFTVADGQGNQYQLETTTSIGSAGTTTAIFQASLLGPIQSGIGTITTVSTPQLGVTSVTNGAAPISVGVPQETDSALRIRRANSVELPSKGYLQGLEAAIYAVDGVEQVVVLENTSNTTDGNGIPGHSIWVIVLCPTSSNAGVAQAIYNKRNAGCGQMHGGAGAVAVPTLSGTGVASVAVTNPGLGFYVAPTVSFVGGGGSGATATATVNTSGQITAVTVTAAGTGYTSLPTVVFNSPTIQTLINQLDGTQFPIVFDPPTQDNLTFTATVDAVEGAIDLTALKNAIAAGTTYLIGQDATASGLTALIMSLTPNATVSNALINAYGGTPGSLKAPSGPNHQFVLTAGNITLSS